MKKWYVYIVKCADASLYTGITTDPEKRLLVHNAGKGAKYTRVRLPVAMIYRRELGDKSAASREEYRIKKLSRTEKLALVGILAPLDTNFY